MLLYNPREKLTPSELLLIEATRLRRERMASKAVRETIEILEPEDKAKTGVPIKETEEDWAARHKRMWAKTIEKIDAEPPQPLPKYSVKKIQKICSEHAGLTLNELLADRRDKTIVRARQIAMWLVKRYTPYSLPRIGRFFAGKDHTTVLHATRKVETRINTDPEFAREIETLRVQIEEMP